ncbi:MAG: TonB-dependent receptor [Ideonella sp.]|nr:TonB-dependent receptor [Ideonella sp.]
MSQRTQDAQGVGLSNSPRAMFKLLYSQALLGDALQASWQVLALSRRSANKGDLPGYAIGNFHLLWRPEPRLDLSLGLYNLTGQRYIDSIGADVMVAQPGRTWQLGLTWRFGS